MKKIAKFIFFSIIGLLLLIFSSLAIGYFVFSKNIIQYTIDQINKRIFLTIYVDKVKFDVIKNFPKAAIEFENVKILSKSNIPDTLVLAKDIYLQFNWIDILFKKYKIQGVVLQNANIYLKLDSLGNIPYIINKENNGISGNNHFIIKYLHIINSVFTLETFDKNSLHVAINDLTFRGLLSKQLDGQLKLKVRKFEYFYNNNNFKWGNFTISSIFQSDSSSMLLKGNVYTLNEKIWLSFHKTRDIFLIKIIGNNIKGKNIQTFFKKTERNLILSSLISLNIDIKAKRPFKEKLFLSGKINYINNNFPLTNHIVSRIQGKLFVEGYPFKDEIQCMINDITLERGSTVVKLNGELNYSKSIVHTNFKGKAKLSFEDLAPFFDSSSFKVSNGIIVLDFELIKNSKKDNFFNFENWNYKFSGSGDNIKLFWNNLDLDSIKTKFSAQNKSIYFEELHVSSGLNKLSFHGKYSWDKSSYLQGKFTIFNIGIDSILNIFNSTDTLNKSSYIDLNVSIKNASYKSMLLKDAHLKFEKKDSIVSIKNFNGNIWNGKIENFNFINNGSYFNTSGKIHNIPINELFILFDNFKQNEIKSSNIEGQLYGNFTFSGYLINNKIAYNNLLGSANLSLYKGRIKKLSILKEIMKYIHIRQPDDVHLKPLHLNVIINNNTVWIDPTRIQSSAIDFTFSGQHNFDEQYEYHFSFYLTDLLEKKEKEKNTSIPVVEVEDSTKKSIVYLKLKGVKNNYKIFYDTKAGIESFKNRWKKEQRDFKNLIQETVTGNNYDIKNKYEKDDNKIISPKVILDDEIDKESAPVSSPKKGTQKKPTIEWKDDEY